MSFLSALSLQTRTVYSLRPGSLQFESVQICDAKDIKIFTCTGERNASSAVLGSFNYVFLGGFVKTVFLHCQ